jgi:hypothetical protein
MLCLWDLTFRKSGKEWAHHLALSNPVLSIIL